MRIETDILISGGGIAGLTAAVALGRAGFRVICTDPAPPVTEPEAPGADIRTTAFLQPAQALLDEAGLWSAMAADAAPLQRMRIADLGQDGAIRSDRTFDAAEISDRPFGWNLPNWLLRRVLAEAIAATPAVEFRPGVATTGYLGRTAEARLTLSDGTKISARLAIAADGRNSPLRTMAGIGVRTYRYGQKALVFAVAHDAPHLDTSTEVHRKGGPFTLVPLPADGGRPRSSIVWMEKGPEAARLAALPPEALAAAATERSGGVLGPLTLVSPVALWPIIAQEATALTATRLALMAEAAHVVPPIGAQGLNMSLNDLAALLDLARANPSDLGSDTMLDAYARRRRADIATRVAGIDALNRASMAGSTGLRDLRAEGIKLLHDAAPIRRRLMQAGLGLSTSW